MDQTFSRFNETYNSLSTVEQANERLLSRDKDIVLNTLSEVILKHGLQDTICIRLLHNHNSIGKNELMLESEERDASGESCLVTVAKGARGVQITQQNIFGNNNTGLVKINIRLKKLLHTAAFL